MSDHTKNAIDTFLNLIDKERNVYEEAQLFHQTRKPISEYVNILQDPITGNEIVLKNQELISDCHYSAKNGIANFINEDVNSEEWKRLNVQFLNYHKSLSVYTAVNCSPLINYLSLKTEIGLRKNIKVLDVGGGTGHTHCSFFQFPETIEYYLLDPNLRLLHDQFIRFYPKLSYLPMGHIIANAEQLPIKDNSFDLVLNISAIDHLNDYKKFISESFRVLKTNGTILISSHLDIPPESNDKTKVKTKIFSFSFWERLSRFLYYRKHKVGDDDHTLHLENMDPIETALINNGFKITKKEIFKRYFWITASKK
jgi:ubiquinone/menaquinone biosynthesis C-methylase UbiE